MATKTKVKRTLGNMVVFDPITKKFTQKGHLVHGAKLLQYEEGICEYCSNKYPKHRKKQRFCKTACRMKWWIRQQHDGKDPDYGKVACVICGNEFQKTRPWSKYCSPSCQTEGRKRLTAQSKEQEPAQASV